MIYMTFYINFTASPRLSVSHIFYQQNLTLTLKPVIAYIDNIASLHRLKPQAFCHIFLEVHRQSSNGKQDNSSIHISLRYLRPTSQ